MNKELQDLAWRCLPREFREEVKNVTQRYSYRALALFGKERQLANKFYDDFINLFGRHNLTSDAEGEDEMLCVSRKDMQFYYQYYKTKRESESSAEQKAYYKGRTKVLLDLFGSKCLPDNVDSSEPNVESSEPNVDSLPQNPTENCDNKSHISADCNKPAEPNFKVGDMAVVRGFKHPLLKSDGAIVTILSYHEKDDFYSCAIAPNIGIVVAAKYLEPYTEPTNFGREVNFPTKNNLAIYLKKSKNCDNRLQIAAVAMQGILSNIDLFKNALETGTEILSGDGIPYRAVAKASLLFADALIAESEKRSGHGK